MCGLKFSTYSSKYKAVRFLDYMVKLLIYVKDVRIVSGSSFVYKCPSILATFVEKSPILPPLNYICSFVKDNLTMFVWV